MTDEDFDGHSPIVRYEVTGCAAYSRISPLLPDTWVDANSSPEQTEDSAVTDFLWENAPRHQTRPYRDHVKCYSHLPNGTAILDSKWVLARLLGCARRDSSQAGDKQKLATLESYCFRGVSGFRSFLDREASRPDSAKRYHPSHNFDLLDRAPPPPSDIGVQESPGLWVVKDASSNGAGGVWVVGNENYDQFCDNAASPLIEEHRYVAQRYAWPLVLYGGRKCHVRVYGLFTSDGRAFVHKRAFLHVANDLFTTTAGETKRNEYEPSVHITNCCANSHDPTKFSGEILADLQSTDARLSTESGETVVALGSFWDSISASVAELARRTSPFLQGGEANNGFEYLGMDFILSYSEGKPVAYLLEVNAPPSQDTATGLTYAEELHDSVIRDIFSLWVFPKVNGFGPEVPGGWRCVHKEPKREVVKESKFIAPSKAAILNKIRWALYEQKLSRRDGIEDGPPPEFRKDEMALHRSSIATAQEVADMSAYARTYFPYYDDRGGSQSRASQQQAFFENAGGSQVPVQVIDAVCSSLRCRNRSVIGSNSKAAAKDVFRTLLGATHHDIFLGSNATSLLSLLAAQYARSGFLKKSDEIVISSENHLANVKPWVQAASAVGAIVKWWNPAAIPIEEVLSSKTRLVAVPHASNILGQILDVTSIRKAVDQVTLGAAHLIVDGVTAVPHCFAAVDEMDADWYVVSCHKLFGPHLGALCGRLSTVEKIVFKGEKATDALEIGTVSYEACAGIQGLGEYFGQLSMYSSVSRNQTCFTDDQQETRQASNQSSREGVSRARKEAVESTALRLTTARVEEAYRLIRLIETPLADLLLTRLKRSTKVRVIETNCVELVARLPIVSFRHDEIPSSTIVEICKKAGVACRCGTFLCTGLLQNDYAFDCKNDIVRFSLAHYNCSYEVEYAIRVLESLPGWF